MTRMTTRTVEPGIDCVLYARLSREDSKGKAMSIEHQSRALLAYAPGAPLVIDKFVSGETNLSDPKSNWNKQLRPLIEKNPKIRVVVFTLDRMGRKKGLMNYEVEKLLDGGGSLYSVRDDRLFDDMDDAAQAIEIMIASYNADTYRVEISKKTKAALDPMIDAEIPVGKKPELYDRDIARIKELRALGLGYESIGKVMTKRQKSDGKLVKRSAALIKKVLNGNYESRDAYDRRDREQREKFAAGNILARYGGESVDA